MYGETHQPAQSLKPTISPTCETDNLHTGERRCESFITLAGAQVIHMNGQFCDYTLLDELGHGGMGTVYRAKNTAGEVVALKVMAPNLAKDKGIRERFIREPRMYPKHENIVQILNAGECDGTPFFAMALIQGDSFDSVLQRHRELAPSQFVPVLRDVAAALDHVHRQGIIHRDIKPSNILMRESDDRAFLTDFGVAKNTLGTKLTQVSGVRIGTAHYMSPEQAMGKRDLTPATDIYALGVMAYHAISGRVPFDADSDVVVARMHMQDIPPDLRKVNPRISPALSAVVMRTLEKDPRKRFASAGAFAAAFEKAASQSDQAPVAAAPSRVWMGLSAAVLVITALAAVWLLSGNSTGAGIGGPATQSVLITVTQPGVIAVLATNTIDSTQTSGNPATATVIGVETNALTPVVAGPTDLTTTPETPTTDSTDAATSTLAPTSTATRTPKPPTRTPTPTKTHTPTPTDPPTHTPTPSVTHSPIITHTPHIKLTSLVFPPIKVKGTLVKQVIDSTISPTIIVIEPVATKGLVVIDPNPIIIATTKLRLPPIKIIATKPP